jgi:hypothetical protein
MADFEIGHSSATATALDQDASNYTRALTLHPTTGATFAGTVTAPQVSLSTTSTTDSVLRLIDAGVIAYDWSFPDTGTIKLGVSATSTKTLKLINAGSGSFNIEASNLSGTNTGDQDLSSYLTASSTQAKYLRSDTEDEGTMINLGGEISAGSSAKLQVQGFMRTGPMMIKAETEEARGVHFNPKCLKRAKNVYKMILDLWITEVDDMYRIDYEK